MKRVISLIIILAMATTAILMALPAMAATPEGTAISSAVDFAAMTSSGKYYLTKDITISAPYNGIFKGTLDGNGKKIIIASGANVSPFNKIEGATVKNITVEGIINILSKKTYGGISAEGYGSFENVTSKVGISAMVENSFNSVGASQGGFIGIATGNCSFENCKNEASVTVITETKGVASSSDAGFGGFIGKAYSSDAQISFINCENNAAIFSREPGINAGGFIGLSYNSNLSFESCSNNAFVTGVAQNEYHNGSGGFVGVMKGNSLVIKDSQNNCDVINNGPTGHTGGFVGALSGVQNVTIERSKNTRAVYNTSNYWEGVGGFVGIMGDFSGKGSYAFVDCVNSGWVQGSMAGGLVGIENSVHGIDFRFERCVNTAGVKTIGIAYAGGIIGRTNGEHNSLIFSGCLNTGDISTATDSCGPAGICGNIGVDGGDYTYIPIFENCVNTGNISCHPLYDVVYAAGILSRNIYMPTTIRNCVNLGSLSDTKNSHVAPITPKYDPTVSVSGCSYLSGSGGSAIWGESAKSVSNIRADVIKALTSGLLSESDYCNYRNSDSLVNSIGEAVDALNSATTVGDIAANAVVIVTCRSSLVPISDKKAELAFALGNKIDNADGKYAADSYAAYSAAYDKIMNDINSASTEEALDAINVESLKAAAEAKLVLAADAKKAELLAELGNKILNTDGKYTAESYEAYSTAYEAVKSIIEAANDTATLEAIDVEALKVVAESMLVEVPKPEPEPEPQPPEGGDVIGGDVIPDDSDKVTDKVTENIQTESADSSSGTTDTKETDAPAPAKKKCGSTVAISALAVACIIGMGLTIKKKD